ncbi:MAG TPA: hypothetical protein VD766_12665 [Solirubrobacterales bacterium]|nr:hypothetical protein [Solirubrobacterales bacterium]
MRSRNLVITAVTAGLALWAAPSAGATTINAGFDADNEGFQVRDVDFGSQDPPAVFDAEWVATDGNPGGFIRYTDNDQAPDEKYGEIVVPTPTESADYGADLSVDLRTNAASVDFPTSIFIAGPGGTIACGFGFIDTAWTTYSAVISASDPCWTMTGGEDAERADVEAALDGGEIFFFADNAGEPGEVNDADNFTLTPSNDTTPPETTIDSGPADGSTIDDNTPTFEFSSDDPDSILTCEVDGAVTDCASPFTLRPLSNATHTFSVYATDLHDNVDPTPETRTFTVDDPDGGGELLNATFDQDNEGFVTFIDDGGGALVDEPSQYEAVGGNPGGFIRYTDPGSPGAQGFFAAPIRTESTDYGGAVSFDMQSSATEVRPNGTGIVYVTLSGPNGGVFCDLTAPNPLWTNYSVPIDASDPCWITGEGDATEADMQAALDGGQVFLNADFGDGPGELSDLDNFVYEVPDGSTDTTPPDTEIDTGPAEGSTITTDSTSFEFSSDEPNSTFECKLDAGAFEPCTSPRNLSALSNGFHVFQVRATDAAGNTDGSPASRSFTVDAEPPPDTTPPETTIDTGPAEGSTITTDSTSFEFSSNEANSTFECKLDGGAFEVCTSPRNLSGLTNGFHTFQVRATDAAGNTDQSPASRSFTVDAGPPPDETAPEVEIDKVKGKAKKKTAKLEFTGSDDVSDEADLEFSCQIDDKAAVDCTSPHTFTKVKKGEHTVTVIATDEAGNESDPATDTFKQKKKKK